MQELWDHPQLKARDRWREVGTPAGPVEAMKPPLQYGRLRAAHGRGPALGAHSRAILSELGFSSVEIQRMTREKVIEEENRP
jgi:crotonobetainyl-CoA:carnitine CoA-transferase CaiB-like acyl-CoA transferase